MLHLQSFRGFIFTFSNLEPKGAAFKLDWLRGKTADQEGTASTSEEAFFGVSLNQGCKSINSNQFSCSHRAYFIPCAKAHSILRTVHKDTAQIMLRAGN